MSAVSAMDVVGEEKVTVIVYDGETVTLSEREWDILRQSCSESIREMLYKGGNISLPGISKYALKLLIISLVNLREFEAEDKAWHQAVFNPRVAELNRRAIDSNIPMWHGDAARKELDEEVKRAAKFKVRRAKSRTTALVHSLFLIGNYRDYMAALKAADYLGIDCILNKLSNMLVISVKLMSDGLIAPTFLNLSDGTMSMRGSE